MAHILQSEGLGNETDRTVYSEPEIKPDPLKAGSVFEPASSEGTQRSQQAAQLPSWGLLRPGISNFPEPTGGNLVD